MILGKIKYIEAKLLPVNNAKISSFNMNATGVIPECSPDKRHYLVDNLKCPLDKHLWEEYKTLILKNHDVFAKDKYDPQTIPISCKGGFNQQHVAVKSHQELKVGKGCKVSTNKYKFESGFDISVDDKIQHWPTIWNLSDVYFDTNADTLHDVIRSLDI
jgi:hypothetical protein